MAAAVAEGIGRAVAGGASGGLLHLERPAVDAGAQVDGFDGEPDLVRPDCCRSARSQAAQAAASATSQLTRTTGAHALDLDLAGHCGVGLGDRDRNQGEGRRSWRRMAAYRDPFGDRSAIPVLDPAAHEVGIEPVDQDDGGH